MRSFRSSDTRVYTAKNTAVTDQPNARGPGRCFPSAVPQSDNVRSEDIRPNHGPLNRCTVSTLAPTVVDSEDAPAIRPWIPGLSSDSPGSGNPPERRR
ncbi:hypothetical protein Stsp01_12410 [Streptomyces sp. NBRC 13847]|nr:hypothetical protein Stsp01_12410 [Streptomyces sp. NBRC 13847]